MSKKRHTRTPYEKHSLEGMVKKRHPHAHSTGNFKELKCYESSYFELTLLYHHRKLKIYNQGNYLGSKFQGSRLPAQLISRQMGMKNVKR